MTDLNINLSAQLQTKLGQQGVWAYAVYFSGGAQWTPLVDNGAVQSGGQSTISLPDPYPAGKIYFLIQSQALSQPNDLETLITSESDINWTNASSWDFRYDSFEVDLTNGENDEGNLTSVNGFGLPMQVSVTYSDNTTSTRGYNATAASILNQISNIGDNTTLFDYTSGPLDGDPRQGISPAEALGQQPKNPAFEAADWRPYVRSLIHKDHGVSVAGYFNGAADVNGVWHNAGFYSYDLEWHDRAFWLTPNRNSEIRGEIKITAAALANSIYATLGNVGVYASEHGRPYHILDHAPYPHDRFTMNTGENNQWGEVLTQILTGFTAGYYGTEGQSLNSRVGRGIDLNKNWNWDPTYAFGQNLAGDAAPFQNPYAQIFFQNSNSYGTGYGDALMQAYATGGPLISVAEPGQNQDVTDIDITIYDDAETPQGYTAPTIYNYIAPGTGGYQAPASGTSQNSIKLNFRLEDMVLARNTPLSLVIHTSDGWKRVEFDARGQSPWQQWNIVETGDGYKATLNKGTPQGAGQLLISGFPTAEDGVAWYRLNVGRGETLKTFNLYVESSGGEFLNPAYNGQAGSIAVDGLATISPQSSADATIPTFTINFATGTTIAADPNLFVRLHSATDNDGIPNAPVAGTLTGHAFHALAGQSQQATNTISTSDSAIAFGWTGTNDSTPDTQSWISGYTNKVGGQNFAKIEIVESGGSTLSPIADRADIDGQWVTHQRNLPNGTYLITMSEYLWNDRKLNHPVGDKSSVLQLTVNAEELGLAATEKGSALRLVPGGDAPAGNWIALDMLRASVPAGTTLVLYATDKDGNLVGRDGKAGGGVSLGDAALGTIGAMLNDDGDLYRLGKQAVFLPTGQHLHFATISADNAVDLDPSAAIATQHGGMRVSVGGFVLHAETDNTLSARALLADAQRETGAALTYLTHGQKVEVRLSGDADSKNALHFVRIDVDSFTGEWSVGGVEYGDTHAFHRAVQRHLDDGFHFTGDDDRFSASKTWTVDGKTGFYAPVLITGEGDTLLIGDASPGGIDPVRMFGQNLFGFEDGTTPWLSSDYNDMVVELIPHPVPFGRLADNLLDA